MCEENSAQRGSATTGGARNSGMRARRWCVASCYHAPEAYGIPELSEWSVTRTSDSVAFAESEDAEPFIRAGNPVRVRR